MSLQSGDSASAGPPDEHQSRPESAASSAPDTGGEQDSFQDAVDNADSSADTVDAVSVRSLTKRSVSVAATRDPPPHSENSSEGKEDVNVKTKEEDSDKDKAIEPAKPESRPESLRPSSVLSNRISHTSNLDNVNLDDDNSTKAEEITSPLEKEVAGKTLSLSSITSALPAMPWSPSVESPAKSPEPSLNAVTSPPPLPPGPPTRKLTSPFSWLSRNSTSKDKDSSILQQGNHAGRRNTASSIATLTSNSEMMLSKLDEKGEGANAASGLQRESLRDRFKAVRLREEAGIHMVPGDSDGQGNALGLVSPGSESSPADKPQQNVPKTTRDLAPGTASGINAGPSAMQESQVDWDLWQSVVYEGPAAVARTSSEELNKAIATGIPSAIRGVVWQVLAQSKNDQLEVLYRDLIARGTENEKRNSGSTATSSASNSGNVASINGDGAVSSASSIHSNQSVNHGSVSPRSEKGQEAMARAQAAVVMSAADKKKQKEDVAAIQKLEKTIRRDLGARTSYSKYAAAAGLQEGLFGICKAYALFDEGVGYAQGMNFLMMPLLFNMPEEEAFCMLVKLMHHYHLRDLFVQDMPGLHLHLYEFERLLEDLEPALYCHLHRRGISPHLYATQWFLTLFAYRFPLQLVLRIYDLILSEGLSAILRFGIVLMQKNAATLLGISDMQQLTTYLKDKLFDVYIDKDPSQGSILENGFFGSSSSSMDKEVYRADQLVRDACEVKITPETLKMYTAEWEEKTKAEKGREMELQDLRLANQSLAVQVRKLEGRVQACDTEQTAMVNQLVHIKLDNEKLRDENESLSGQVTELKSVIERQPAEIEGEWNQEKKELIAHNVELHAEKQKLTQSLEELEAQLIETKVRYAEINAQHETLNRRWFDLKRQFA